MADPALALRAAYLDGRLLVVVPSLVAYELANVLRYTEDLSIDQVQQAVQSLFDMGLEWVSPSGTMMRRAVEIGRVYETTVYDAAFAALAESLSSTFVTADKRLARCLEPLAVVRFLGDMEEA